MGMFDTFRIVNPNDDRWANGEGKLFKNLSLQSKDFDNNMSTYYVWGDRGFECGLREDLDENFIIDQDRLVCALSYRESKLTGRGRLYTQDKLTKPVLALVSAAGWHGNISERWAWCEWDVDFDGGRLTKLVRVKAPTRDDLLKEVQENFGDCLLADDHPVAAKHFWELGFK